MSSVANVYDLSVPDFGCKPLDVKVFGFFFLRFKVCGRSPKPGLDIGLISLI